MIKTQDKSFPPLYSLNSDGSIQVWKISVSNNVIHKDYGRQDGKIQTTSDVVAKGKNTGRANETTPAQQALSEAESQWEKKLKSGYTHTIKDATAGKSDAEFVTGGIEPMLAQKYRDHSAKIPFPAYSQPKLDGIRCIAMIHNGVCTLWSRTRKPITGVPHIIAALEAGFKKKTIILDGELYNHAYKNKFEEIVSFVRQETPKTGHEVVQYHIYDIVDSKSPFADRVESLYSFRLKNPLIPVYTRLVENGDVLTQHFVDDRAEGYEGTMARNKHGLYEHKRSYNLQKIKEFDDAEFKIVGIESGRGRMAGCAVFECETKKGERFNCKMEGSLEVLKEIFDSPKKALGKKLTVRYQGMTNGNVPRFPIGVSIRDYE